MASIQRWGSVARFAALMLLVTGARGQQIVKLIAEDGSAGDTFGGAVSISASTLIVGAHRDDDAGNDSGSVYVFRENAGAWQQIMKFTAIDARAFAEFGFSVALDNDSFVVGSPGHDGAGTRGGLVYLFGRINNTWRQLRTLDADDTSAGDEFGASVAISRFRDKRGTHRGVALVGARGDDDAGALSGSAYVFFALGQIWRRGPKLIADDAAAGDQFGESVAVSVDTAVIGAPGDDDAGESSGSAYVFREIDDQWFQIAKLTADDGAPGDQFGVSVAIDGNTAVVGAFQHDSGGSNAGAAYIFREIDGQWRQTAKLTARDPSFNDRFGGGVAISGSRVIIAAAGDDVVGSDSGSAYMFQEIDGAWEQVAKIIPDDAASNDRFGADVSISGNRVLVGSPLHGGADSGAAYVFGTCPADLDLDGDADQDDFFQFLDLFALGDPRADLDRDGNLDANDLSRFLEVFVARCE